MTKRPPGLWWSLKTLFWCCVSWCVPNNMPVRRKVLEGVQYGIDQGWIDEQKLLEDVLRRIARDP